MNKVNLSKIREYLLGYTSITDLGFEIFIQQPKREPQDTYMIISLFSDVIDTAVSKKAGISCRILATSENTPLSDLYDIANEVTYLLTQNYESMGNTYDFGAFKVTEIGISQPLADEKNRFEIVKDFVFYYAI